MHENNSQLLEASLIEDKDLCQKICFCLDVVHSQCEKYYTRDILLTTLMKMVCCHETKVVTGFCGLKHSSPLSSFEQYIGLCPMLMTQGLAARLVGRLAFCKSASSQSY